MATLFADIVVPGPRLEQVPLVGLPAYVCALEATTIPGPVGLEFNTSANALLEERALIRTIWGDTPKWGLYSQEFGVGASRNPNSLLSYQAMRTAPVDSFQFSNFDGLGQQEFWLDVPSGWVVRLFLFNSGD